MRTTNKQSKRNYQYTMYYFGTLIVGFDPTNQNLRTKPIKLVQLSSLIRFDLNQQGWTFIS